MQKENHKKNWKKNWKTKQSRAAIVLLAGFFVLCGGCSRKKETQMSGVLAESAYEAAGGETAGEIDKKKTEVHSGEDASAASEVSDDLRLHESSGLMTETEKIIYVHICGAVKHPGVYPITEGTRVYEAVALAGGFLPEADEQWLNQAAVIQDAQKVYVYSKEETSQMEAEPLQSVGNADALTASPAEGTELVNLNTASKEELMTLPGIGEAKAEAILQYRSEHGAFSCAEDLLEISGIKEGVFSRMKDRITVK